MQRPWRLLLIFMLCLPLPGMASDLEREQRLAEQIVDAIFDGEPLYLKAGEQRFLGIYMEADQPTRRAVLIVHGRGFHPDWEQVARPLRVGLTEHGWDTLSIQMPVLAKDAKYYDYIPTFNQAVPRIEAAIEFLRHRGYREIVLIAHSCGVHMSMEWVRLKGTGSIDAYVGIGMGATDYKQPMTEPLPLERITVPVLDVYGDMDYPAVQRGAAARLAAIQEQGHPGSRQIVIGEADHYMNERDSELVEAVAAWLSDVFGEEGPLDRGRSAN